MIIFFNAEDEIFWENILFIFSIIFNFRDQGFILGYEQEDFDFVLDFLFLFLVQIVLTFLVSYSLLSIALISVTAEQLWLYICLIRLSFCIIIIIFYFCKVVYVKNLWITDQKLKLKTIICFIVFAASPNLKRFVCGVVTRVVKRFVKYLKKMILFSYFCEGFIESSDFGV